MAQNTDFASIAVKEAGNGPSKYRKWYYGYSGSGIDWCAVFVSWCASQLGVLNKLVPKSDGAGCFAREGVAKGWGKWYENGTIPRVGDIITFCWNGMGYQPGQDKYYSNHVGIVTEVKNGTVYVVEGNTGGSDNNYTTVKKKSYAVKNIYINGYYRPNWKTADVKPTAPTTNQPASTGKEGIKQVQRWLNATYGTVCTIDGVYGPQTKSALVGSLQCYLNTNYNAKLTVDGVFGKQSKSKIGIVAKGAKGNCTKILQGALICHGYYTGGFDGIFGDKTHAAVKQFQQKHRLSADGIAGKETFASLLS